MQKDVTERISQLRDLMKQKGIDYYLVPTSDFHESEYVGEYFKARSFITGFTGSAGTAVIGLTTAGLWTDGRYFIQAQTQLQGTNITLYRMFEENVLTIEEFFEKNLKTGQVIGFDGRVVNTSLAKKYEDIVAKKEGKLYTQEDLIDLIWSDRPRLLNTLAFVLENEYVGKTTAEKLLEVREKMKEKGANLHLLSSLYDIAWLLNVRGGDILHVPVILSYLMIEESRCVWFVRKEVLTDHVKDYLNLNQIKIMPYEAIYDYMKEINNQSILLDQKSVNYQLVSSLSENVDIIDETNPTELLKAIKNSIEINNTIQAHIKDGVAFTKFMYWLKTNIGIIEMTEISASDYLEARRKEQEHFLDLSFETISGYGPNAAMMHYAATPESDAKILQEGLLLVDSGGHYLEGSTDITRTIAMGPLSDEMKEHFTAVTCGNLNLASAKFLYGCCGMNLDILSRAPLWDLNMDYKCGTGHGIGHILNVHEGPNGFRWKQSDNKKEAIFEEGMITTDEPGVYIEGQYGIRIENELVCRKGEKNEYGQFMYFETITYAPIDLDAIVPEQMSKKEKEKLNQYHKMVYQILSPYLTKEEVLWLKEYTRTI